MTAETAYAGPTIATNWRASDTFMNFSLNAIDCERAALGCVYLNENAIHDLVEILGDDPGVFDNHYCQKVYALFCEDYRANRGADVVRHLEKLRREEDEKPSDGWPIFLTDLAASVQTSTHVRDYARAVREAFETSEAVHACEILSTAKRPGELLPQTIIKLNAFTNRTDDPAVARIGGDLDNAVSELESRARGEFTAAYATGYRRVDEMLRGGLHKGETVVVAARTSDGKTAFLLNVARNVAQRGTPILFFSSEMSRETIAARLISIVGGVNTHRIQSGWQVEKELQRARAAAMQARELPLFIDDTAAIDIAKLSTRTAMFVRKNPNALIVIDYLQLVTSGHKFGTREAEVAHVSREIKRIARQTNCPVLLACQLSRESEKEPDHYRKLSFMRESGAIEQDADVVIILAGIQEKEVSAFAGEYRGDVARLRESSVLCVAKHRNGPVGKLLLHFDRSTQRISDFDAPQSEGQLFEDEI
jgi:replicative DNA helicase